MNQAGAEEYSIIRTCPNTRIMAALSLLEDVRQDIQTYLQEKLQELLFNERDLQMHLALYLRGTGKYDDVDLEYYVPTEELNGYLELWETEMRMDIVVKRQGEFLPVELKYKTKKVTRQILRFDEQLEQKYDVMKDQSAQDLGKYDFWKDVRRLELVRQRFATVHHGLAVFMTNDSSYTRLSRPTSNVYHFCMQEGQTPRAKHWLDPHTPTASKRPDFDVEQEYEIHWEQRTVEEVDFHYCLVSV